MNEQSTTIRAIVIDPFNKTITETNITEDAGAQKLKDIYAALDCCLITAAGDFEIDGKTYTLYVDDEGLLKENQSFFKFSPLNYQPFAGKGLIVGFDENTGDSVCVGDLPLTAIADKVDFITDARELLGYE
jgi:hypothetical protein